jgi:hypothetical protein
MKQLIKRVTERGRVALINSLYKDNKEDVHGMMVFNTATKYELVLEIHAEFTIDDDLPSEYKKEAEVIAAKRIARVLYKELFPLVEDMRMALFASDRDKAMDALLKIESNIKDPLFVGIRNEHSR